MTSIWGSVSKELQWTQSGEFEIFILYNLLPYGKILWIILYWNILCFVCYRGRNEFYYPIHCSITFLDCWSCTSLVEKLLKHSYYEVGWKYLVFFANYIMPLTLSVLKLNLCITNHDCLWKRPACDKWLPLRISYRRITVKTRNNI